MTNPIFFVKLDSGNCCNAGSSGYVATLFESLLQMFSTSLLDGAATTLAAATAPVVRQKANRYFDSYLNPGVALGNSSDLSLDAGKARELWDLK